MCKANVLIVNTKLTQDFEQLRKSIQHKWLTKTEMFDKIENETSICLDVKLWQLLINFGIITKIGSARATKYCISKDMVSFKTFENLRDKYNERLRRKIVAAPETKETRQILNEAFCINYLKERGYIIGKLKPNMTKLRTFFDEKEIVEFCDIETV